MSQTNDWSKKYFNDEQLQQMEELSKQSYTEEDRRKLAEWGKNFTEEDQRRVDQQWSAVFAELKQLVSTGQSPASPEAQSLVTRWHDLVNQFTRGDAGIEQGLSNWYSNADKLPAEKRPFTLPITEQESAFIQEAMEIHRQNQGQ